MGRNIQRFHRYRKYHRFYENLVQTRPNVILANRTKLSSTKDTRKGLGKSLLLSIIDYCLGGDGKDVRIEQLRDWSFTFDVTIFGTRVQVTRFVENDQRIYIEGSTDNFCIKPAIDTDNGQMFYSNDQWKIVLGRVDI